MLPDDSVVVFSPPSYYFQSQGVGAWTDGNVRECRSLPLNLCLSAVGSHVVALELRIAELQKGGGSRFGQRDIAQEHGQEAGML